MNTTIVPPKFNPNLLIDSTEYQPSHQAINWCTEQVIEGAKYFVYSHMKLIFFAGLIIGLGIFANAIKNQFHDDTHKKICVFIYDIALWVAFLLIIGFVYVNANRF